MVSTTQSVFLTRRTSCTKELKFARLSYSRKIAQVKNGKEKAKENEHKWKRTSQGSSPALPRKMCFETKKVCFQKLKTTRLNYVS